MKHLKIGFYCFVFIALVIAPAKSLYANTSYYRALFEKDTATFIDGCRAIYLLKTNNRDLVEYDKIFDFLEESGVVPAKWKRNPDRPLTWEVISYMICKEFNIKGGVIMRAFGVRRKYAYRECMFLRLVPAQRTRRYLTGIDLLTVMSRIEKYKEAKIANQSWPP